MTVAASIFVGASLLVVAAGFASTDVAYTAMVAAVVAVGVGECFHTTVLMPLVAELAPAGVRGRYMASMGVVVDRPGARADPGHAAAEPR